MSIGRLTERDVERLHMLSIAASVAGGSLWGRPFGYWLLERALGARR